MKLSTLSLDHLGLVAGVFDITMDGELMLQYYKGQNAVEKGFRFLKDKGFRVAEIYLKKEERKAYAEAYFKMVIPKV